MLGVGVGAWGWENVQGGRAKIPLAELQVLSGIDNLSPPLSRFLLTDNFHPTAFMFVCTPRRLSAFKDGALRRHCQEDG